MTHEESLAKRREYYANRTEYQKQKRSELNKRYWAGLSRERLDTINTRRRAARKRGRLV